MKNLIKLSLLLNGVLLGSCQDSSSKNSINSEIKNDSAIISFRLKKNERCLFNYCDIFFNHRDLIFSNPGNSDSIFSKTLSIEMPTSINYGFVSSDIYNTSTFTEYYYLILPGDSITFSLDSGRYLKVDTLHSNRILNNPSVTYNPTFDSVLKNYKVPNSHTEWVQNFKKYYLSLSQNQLLENKRIKQSSANAGKDNNYLQLHSEILFYKNLFNYIYKEKKFTPAITEQYLPFLANTKAVINNPKPILSQNLLALFYGHLQVSLMNKKKDFNNYELLYDEALESDMGRFKPGLLTSFLDIVPKNNSTYKRIKSDIKKRYKGTRYETYIVELEEQELKISKVILNDSLMNINKQKIAWDDLVNGKKDIFVFVDFWASWCAPCRAQMPLLDSLKRFFKDAPIEFVSLNIDKNADDWIMASEAEKIFLKYNNFHLTETEKSGIIQKWNINSIPRYMIFKDGKPVDTNFISPVNLDFRKILEKIISNDK